MSPFLRGFIRGGFQGVAVALLLVFAGLATAQLITGGATGPAGGAVGGSGTLNALARFSAAQTLADSIASQSGTVLTIANTVNVVTGYQIGGVAFAASNLSNGVSGTGAVCLVSNCTLIAPALGTPASGVATNLTGTAAGLTAGNATLAATATALATPRAINGVNFDGSANITVPAASSSGPFAVGSYVELPEQAAPGTPTNAARFFVDTSNRFSWKGENGFVRTFDGTANTADRAYVLPNVGGTIALTSDFASPGPIGSTTPNSISGTFAAFSNGIALTGNSFAAGPSISNASDGLLLVAGATGGVRVNNASNGAELFRVTNAGGVNIGNTVLTLTGGAVGLPRITASGSAPGASGAKLEVVCGANAGTAKLIMAAGTSGTAVTVIDNVGAGVTGC